MIYFVGAGAGDPELITLKGYKLLQEAQLVIYTGSLINKAILKYANPGAELISSAGLNLQEIISLMEDAYNRSEKVVRLHTGDPSLYGAIGEQMEALKAKNIPFSIVPGVSSFLAAAASLKREYTVPGGTQTVIITRLEGRTHVPNGEGLQHLAAHGASMVIFLSTAMIDKVVDELLKSYSPDTPAAVVEKASCPRRILRSFKIKLVSNQGGGITKTALVLVENS